MSTDLGKYRLFFDGVCSGNPGPGGAGVVLINPYEITSFQEGLHLGPSYTSNQVKYAALLFGLHNTRVFGLHDLRHLEIISDSKLLVGQLRGVYDVKDPALRNLHSSALTLLKEFPGYSLTFIPRKYNRLAHHLAQQAVKGHGI